MYFRSRKSTSETRKSKHWAEDHRNDALEEINENRTSIREIGKQYGIPESTLRKRRDMLKEGIPLVGSGSKTALTPEHKKQLALCIGKLCTHGFSPTQSQVTDLVKDYVSLHVIKTPFKENRPGKEWLRNFMKRNKLNTKKANMISYVCMPDTSNPFVVYNFFETIQKIANENNLSPSQVWNCDETGFPTDAAQCKVVAPQRKQPNKITSGAGRENISVLATCCADGYALDPLIIFLG